MLTIEVPGNGSHKPQRFSGNVLVAGATKDAFLTEQGTFFVYEFDTGDYWVCGEIDDLRAHLDAADYDAAVGRFNSLPQSGKE